VIGRRHHASGRRAGNAYLEFGLLCPLLVATLGGVADFGLSIWARSRLAAAVSNGSQFAELSGPTVSAANVKLAVARTAAPLAGVAVTVSGPACHCISGPPAALAPPSHCSTECASGGLPGSYVQISASYNYDPLMPFYAAFAGTTLTETAIVRLQ
jgi:hypothetical protein